MSALLSLVGRQDGDILWDLGSTSEADPLLTEHHYLGPIGSGGTDMIVIGSIDGVVVAAQVWRRPTSRMLPSDGTWLELSRWCLTPAAGPNAGSRMHRHAVALIRSLRPTVTTLVSYSDPSQGHNGALYRACNWTWAPTWHRLRPPPTRGGTWDGATVQEVKDRWVFAVRRDLNRDDVLAIDDEAAIRYWQTNSTVYERRWAQQHPQLGGAA